MRRTLLLVLSGVALVAVSAGVTLAITSGASESDEQDEDELVAEAFQQVTENLRRQYVEALEAFNGDPLAEAATRAVRTSALLTGGSDSIRCGISLSADLPDLSVLTLVSPGGLWSQVTIDPNVGVVPTSLGGGGDYRLAGIDPGSWVPPDVWPCRMEAGQITLVGYGADPQVNEETEIETETEPVATEETETPASTSPLSGFRTPSKNIDCAADENQLYCQIISGLPGAPRCPAPSPEQSPNTITLPHRGSGGTDCASGANPGISEEILPYGTRWSEYGFSCESKSVGLRCTNASGHGFFLSRERWEIFEPSVTGRPQALPDCAGRPESKPRSVTLSCADGGFDAGRLSWRDWGEGAAVADGIASVNNCTPNCADGTYEEYPIELRASGVQRCADGALAYLKVRYSFPGSSPFPPDAPGSLNPEVTFSC